MTTLTDAKGRPLTPPPKPHPDDDIEDKILYLRARARYVDSVTDLANRAFAEAFTRAVREED